MSRAKAAAGSSFAAKGSTRWRAGAPSLLHTQLGRFGHGESGSGMAVTLASGIRRELRSLPRRRAFPPPPPRRAGHGYGLLHRNGFRTLPPERHSGTLRQDPPRCCRVIGAPSVRSLDPSRACSTPAGRSCRFGGGRRRKTGDPGASSPAGRPARRGEIPASDHDRKIIPVPKISNRGREGDSRTPCDILGPPLSEEPSGPLPLPPHDWRARLGIGAFSGGSGSLPFACSAFDPSRASASSGGANPPSRPRMRRSAGYGVVISCCGRRGRSLC